MSMLEALPLALAGLAMMLVAIPLYRRRIRPNALYGLRIPATFRSEHVWYEANHLFARDLFSLGLFVVLLTISAVFFDVQAEAFMAPMVGIMVIAILVILVVNWRRANRILRDQET